MLGSRGLWGLCAATIGIELLVAGAWLTRASDRTGPLIALATLLLMANAMLCGHAGGLRKLNDAATVLMRPRQRRLGVNGAEYVTDIPAAARASRANLARGACAAVIGVEIFLASWWLLSRGAGDVSVGALAGLTVGLNLSLWGGAGGLRWVDERARARRAGRRAHPVIGRWSATGTPIRAGKPLPRRLTPADVAILIPAHNEERVIRGSITSAARILPLADIYVVSDGSSDATVEIAAAAGAKVMDLNPNRGKAGALEAAIDHFRLTERYEVVLFLDADSELDERYLAGALRFFEDPSVAAVAGYATTMWRPRELSIVGQIICAYRDRLYTLQQRLLKYGQTWRLTNVAYIAPGFASAYRSRALRTIELNPPGLIIEDFNMTFQLHRKRVGRIGFSPRVRAAAQDPATLGDYTRQVRRWSLGFWQTIRFNGFWPSRFWIALGLVVFESLVASLAFLAAVVIAVGLALPPLTGDAVLGWDPYADAYTTVAGYVTLPMLALAVLGPDLVLTGVMAAVRRRPRYLVLGLAFPLLRVIDAMLALWTLPLAWLTRSTGSWRSPTRR